MILREFESKLETERMFTITGESLGCDYVRLRAASSSRWGKGFTV